MSEGYRLSRENGNPGLMALIAKKNEEEGEAAPSGARERCEEFAKKIAKDAAIAYDKEILNRGL